MQKGLRLAEEREQEGNALSVHHELSRACLTWEEGACRANMTARGQEDAPLKLKTTALGFFPHVQPFVAIPAALYTSPLIASDTQQAVATMPACVDVDSSDSMFSVLYPHISGLVVLAYSPDGR